MLSATHSLEDTRIKESRVKQWESKLWNWTYTEGEVLKRLEEYRGKIKPDLILALEEFTI